MRPRKDFVNPHPATLKTYEAAAAFVRTGRGHIHCMGAAGVGVAGLATLLRARGFQVSGCDPARNRLTATLAASGIPVETGHDPRHVETADALFHTAAIPGSHPELSAARAAGKLVCPRGIALAALMSAARSIAISGTHGKTTTTAMVVQILRASGINPTFAIGGEVDVLGGVAGTGEDEVLVAESDESDGTLAWYSPVWSVITNVDFDHMEHFRDTQEFHEVFARLVRQTRETVMYGRDDPAATQLARQGIRAVSFGFHPKSDIRAEAWRAEGFGQCFAMVERDAGVSTEVRLPVPGRYNALNALASWAAARAAGANRTAAVAALATFHPARRRMDCAHRGRVTVYSDYAHHPAEIRALFQAVREVRMKEQGRVIAIFQPHRYSRTRALGDQFPGAFEGADHVILAPIYAASESPMEGGSDDDLFRQFDRQHVCPVDRALSLDDAWVRLRDKVRAGDWVLLVGAGDIEKLTARAAELG